MTSTKKDPVLVVLQLAGGNDAMNTVVPHGNPKYYDHRPNVVVPFQRDRRPHLPPTQRIERRIGDDAQKPGLEAGAALKRIQLGEHLDETVLHHVEGIVPPPGDSNRHLERRPPITPEQLPLSVAVSTTRGGDETDFRTMDVLICQSIQPDFE